MLPAAESAARLGQGEGKEALLMAVFLFPSHRIYVLHIKATSASSLNWVGGGGRWQESVFVNISLSALGLEAVMPACHPTAPHAALKSPQLGTSHSLWWGGITKYESRRKRSSQGNSLHAQLSFPRHLQYLLLVFTFPIQWHIFTAYTNIAYEVPPGLQVMLHT